MKEGKNMKYNIRKIYIIIKRKIDRFDWFVKRYVDHDWLFYDRWDGE